MRFVINAPPYFHVSAGIKILHKLCYQLRLAGYDACIDSPSNPAWDNPAFDGKLQPNDIVIYPDCVQGNPLGATKIIRYMLYFTWAYYANQSMPANEMFVPYHEFLLADLNAHSAYELTRKDILEIGIIEPDLFYSDNTTVKDIDVAYWVSSKAEGNVKDFNMPKNAYQITGSLPRTELANVLRRTKTFYNFDMVSMMNYEAFLCGANVFIVTSDKPPRVIDWYGFSEKHNEYLYNDLFRIHAFVARVLEFFKK